MKRSFKPVLFYLGLTAMVLGSSCKKEGSVSSTDEAAALQAAVTGTQSVAVTTNGAGDSVYITHTCEPRDKRDSIDASALPATVVSYLSANYPGYTLAKAFKISEASGTLKGYVTVINFNGNPVGIAFDASGNFVKVLEQREGRDLREGRGYHEGGRFECRDGKQRDTVALSALPASITAYFAANYATDTLLRAGKLKEGGYVVLSKSGGLFATVFSSTGSFVSRVQLPAPKGSITAIEAAALPAAVTTYLTNHYPGYVLNKAFSISANGTIQGYCVAIEANSTKYGLLFDASGNFVAVKTVR
ncbi:MAG: PepSY-like domain-containing protein [Chitinophagaceae bacterium]|nr:PepSY-like domain-containing protein [Chitinophagaceae bacterium]